MNEIKATKDYVEIRTKLKDTVQSWIDRELYELLFYKKVIWKVDDAVFFDKKKERALLLHNCTTKKTLHIRLIMLKLLEPKK